MDRGEIYYVTRPWQCGSEIQAAGRPAIVVSRQYFARTSPVQQVVFLTTRDKPNLETHVQIMSTGRESTALCEQITSVSVDCFGDRCGVCTMEEMEAIDKAIAWGLGIEPPLEVGPITDEDDEDDDSEANLAAALLIAETQRDTYRELYESLLHKMLTRGGTQNG